MSGPEFAEAMRALNIPETFVSGIGLVALTKAVLESGRFVVDAGLGVTTPATPNLPGQPGFTSVFNDLRLSVINSSVFGTGHPAFLANVLIHEAIHWSAMLRNHDGLTSFSPPNSGKIGPGHCEIYMYAAIASGYRERPPDCRGIFRHYGY